MLKEPGVGLASDAIAFHLGFDGHEPDGLINNLSRQIHLGQRCSIAINTHYPEIHGGYFENRALMMLIDDALRTLGFLPAVLDSFVEHGLAVVEPLGHLLSAEQYALADSNQKQVGYLEIWQFHVGGGGEHYRDDVIVDLVLPSAAISQLQESLRTKCSMANVAFTVHSSGSNEMPKPNGILKRIWRQL